MRTWIVVVLFVSLGFNACIGNDDVESEGFSDMVSRTRVSGDNAVQAEGFSDMVDRTSLGGDDDDNETSTQVESSLFPQAGNCREYPLSKIVLGIFTRKLFVTQNAVSNRQRDEPCQIMQNLKSLEDTSLSQESILGWLECSYANKE